MSEEEIEKEEIALRRQVEVSHFWFTWITIVEAFFESLGFMMGKLELQFFLFQGLAPWLWIGLLTLWTISLTFYKRCEKYQTYVTQGNVIKL